MFAAPAAGIIDAIFFLSGRLRGLDEDVNDTPFTATAVAPDGKTVALAEGFGRRAQTLAIVLWDLASGDEVGRIEGLADAQQARNRGGHAFAALAYSPDRRTLAVLLKGPLHPV